MSRPVEPHVCLAPGCRWTRCLCDEIDPADTPCVVCEGRAVLEHACPACRTACMAAVAGEAPR